MQNFCRDECSCNCQTDQFPFIWCAVAGIKVIRQVDLPECFAINGNVDWKAKVNLTYKCKTHFGLRHTCLFSRLYLIAWGGVASSAFAGWTCVFIFNQHHRSAVCQSVEGAKWRLGLEQMEAVLHRCLSGWPQKMLPSALLSCATRSWGFLKKMTNGYIFI